MEKFTKNAKQFICDISFRVFIGDCEDWFKPPLIIPFIIIKALAVFAVILYKKINEDERAVYMWAFYVYIAIAVSIISFVIYDTFLCSKNKEPCSKYFFTTRIKILTMIINHGFHKSEMYREIHMYKKYIQGKTIKEVSLKIGKDGRQALENLNPKIIYFTYTHKSLLKTLEKQNNIHIIRIKRINSIQKKACISKFKKLINAVYDKELAKKIPVPNEWKAITFQKINNKQR